MGIDASNNIKLKQQEKDSPFLTLSERNQKGISSQNIFGGDEKAGQAQEPKRTERIAQLNIFGAEEGGQVKDDTSVFGEQEQKGCDEYFQENAKGEMNFDTNGFYGDAIGVSFGSSAASNPIKAGASDTKGLETELKLMLRNPEQNKTQIENLKEQIKAQGGDADKIIADNTPKTGATKGANATTKAGTTENAAKTATAGTTATGNAANALGSDGSVSDLMAFADQAGIGTQVDIVAGRGSSSSSALSGSSSSSSSAGIGDAIKNAFSPTNIASKAAEGVTGSVVSGVMNPVQETISGYMKDGLKAIGIGKGSDKGGELDAGKAKNAKTADEAKKNQELGAKKEADATSDKTKAKTDGDKAKAGAINEKQKAAQEKVKAGKFEATEAQQTEQAEWQKHEEEIQKATAEEKCAIKEAKKAEGQTIQNNINGLNATISGLQDQLNSLTGTKEEVAVKKTKIQADIATNKAKLAEEQAKLAKCQQEESLATADEAEAQQLSQQAADNAAAAEQSASEAGEAAKAAETNSKLSDQAGATYKAKAEDCQAATKIADGVAKKAKIFKEAAGQRYGQLHYGRQ